MSARRQLDVRRVHYARAEEEEEEEEYEEYGRYQSPSPGPRQRPHHQPHRSRREAAIYNYSHDEILYNA